MYTYMYIHIGYIGIYWLYCSILDPMIRVMMVLWWDIFDLDRFRYIGSTDCSSLISLLATYKLGFTSKSQSPKTIVWCPKIKNYPNHSKSTRRIGPFCWNIWVTAALSLLSASSSCLRPFQSHMKQQSSSSSMKSLPKPRCHNVSAISFLESYDVKKKTKKHVSAASCAPAFSWCQPRSRSEPNSCNACMAATSKHLGRRQIQYPWGCRGIH